MYEEISGPSSRNGKIAINTQSPSRANNQIAKDSVRAKLLKRHNNDPKKVAAIMATLVSQPDILHFEARLIPGTNNYELQLRADTNANGQPTQLRRGLDQNDLVYVHGIRLALRKHLSTSASGPFAGGNSRLFTYVEDAEFLDAGEAFALQSVYNGLLTLATGTTRRLEIPTDHLKFVPQQQIIQATTTTKTDVQFGGNGDESRGFFPLGGQIILDGKDNNRISVSLVDPVTTTNIDGATSTDITINSIAYKQRNYLVVSLAVERFIGLAAGDGAFI